MTPATSNEPDEAFSVSRAAEMLYTAQRDRAPISPLSELHPDLTPEAAYEIQSHLVHRLLTDGGKVVGYKLGLTSEPMQEMFGIGEPDYAPVLSPMVKDDGVAIHLDDYIAPRVEAEIAFVLGRTLSGPAVTTLEAARAIDGAVAALELVDSRIEGWRVALVDTIADLASSASIVLGTRVVRLDGWDPRWVGMVIRRNGRVEATAAGAAALGNPVVAVAWLANKLAPFGVTLEPGQVIMTGALHRAFEPARGDHVRADFDRLGSVACSFV